MNVKRIYFTDRILRNAFGLHLPNPTYAFFRANNIEQMVERKRRCIFAQWNKVFRSSIFTPIPCLLPAKDTLPLKV